MCSPFRFRLTGTRRPRAHAATPLAQRRGSVIVIVLWALAIAALVTSAVQLFGYRQAMLGREAIGRLQTRWAARAGIENTMAVLALNTEKPLADDALAIVREMEAVAQGETFNAGYDIRHYADDREWKGPLDESSRLNLAMSPTNLRNLLLGWDNDRMGGWDISFEMLEALTDWTDPDEDVRDQGAERDYYTNMAFPYRPRNGPVRSVAELELVIGFEPDLVRGEDWNLDNRMDASEDDGVRLWPPDNRDGMLKPGFAAYLTTHSTANGATASGKERIRLGLATQEELQERLKVDAKQAEMLIRFGRNPSSMMSLLVAYPLSRVSADGSVNASEQAGATGAGASGLRSSGRTSTSGGRSSRGSANDGANPSNTNQASGRAGTSSAASAVADLTDEQLRAVLAETMIESKYARVPGKVNINTVTVDLLRRMMGQLAENETLADEIRYLRDSKATGIVSLADLRKVPELAREENRAMLKNLVDYFDTHSNVYTISSRGRSWITGAEIEMIVVVDRSTLPVKILEYREQ